MTPVHATCVAIGGKGVLLCGPSASGKSDLALRLIDGGALLVADDLVALRAEGDEVIATYPDAPEYLQGVVEIYGYGLIKVPHRQEAKVALCVQLIPANQVERLPESATVPLIGIEIASITLDGFGASAPAKIRAALAYERVT